MYGYDIIDLSENYYLVGSVVYTTPSIFTFKAKIPTH